MSQSLQTENRSAVPNYLTTDNPLSIGCRLGWPLNCAPGREVVNGCIQIVEPSPLRDVRSRRAGRVQISRAVIHRRGTCTGCLKANAARRHLARYRAHPDRLWTEARRNSGVHTIHGLGSFHAHQVNRLPSGDEAREKFRNADCLGNISLTISGPRTSVARRF